MENRFVQVYKDIAKVPELKNARILSINNDTDISIQAQWQCRDLVSLEKQTSECHYLVREDIVTSFPSLPVAPNVILQSLSPSGKKTAQIIQTNGERKLLILDSDGETLAIDLLSKQLHGEIYHDPYISCLEWSSDEKKVAFVAEEKRIPPSSFYTPNTGPENIGWGEKHLFIEDWGEQMVGQHQGVVIIVDIATEQIWVRKLPGDLTPGQLIWRPHSDDVIGVAYPSKPYRIGIAYCSDRESIIFAIDQHGKYDELTRRGQHVKSPRFSPSGRKLIFFQSTIYGDRAPAAQLVLLTWSTMKVEVLLDYVNVSLKIKNEKSMVGVCGKSFLPKRCFDISENKIIFSAYQLSNQVTYSIDVETKEIVEITNPKEFSMALDLYQDWILLLKSSHIHPDRLFLSKIKFDCDEANLRLIPVSCERTLKGIHKDWSKMWKFASPLPGKDGKEIVLSALYLGPTENNEGSEKRPLICWPHGGPHSLIGNRFNLALSFFVSLGYSIILPNYRGSVGHGNDFLTASLGQCGKEDVHDCYQSIEECLAKFESILDRRKIFLIGFSHGGFQSMHLAAKYPGYFRAVATMNAATDIYIMATVSDIPEWAFLEYGLPFTLGRTMDKDAVVKMFERSPIHLADSIRTPSLFLLGKNDLRGPHSQGLHFHRLLVARNVPSRVYIYDDNHPLQKISSESDYVIQIAKWFQNYE